MLTPSKPYTANRVKQNHKKVQAQSGLQRHKIQTVSAHNQKFLVRSLGFGWEPEWQDRTGARQQRYLRSVEYASARRCCTARNPRRRPATAAALRPSPATASVPMAASSAPVAACFGWSSAMWPTSLGCVTAASTLHEEFSLPPHAASGVWTLADDLDPESPSLRCQTESGTL